MDAEFTCVQDQFIDRHLDAFEDTEENKLEYMEIFKNWVAVIEKAVDTHLQQNVEKFTMEEFMELLVKREEQVDGPIVEMLLSLGDFANFKELMLERKRESGQSFVPFDFISVTPMSPTGVATGSLQQFGFGK